MKEEYNVYLSINGIDADSIEDAKKKFWNFVDNKRNLLSLEVEKL